MRKKPADEASRWFRQAWADLDDARFVLTGERYHLACYLAQQAAEKGLRAFLYHVGAETVRAHSVADLCRDAADFDQSFKDLAKEAAPLDKFYIATRYPNGLPGGIPSEAFSRADADSAVSLSSMVLDFVEQRLR